MPTTDLPSWYPVSDDVKRLLQLAATHWEDTAQSQVYMEQAIADSENSLAVLVAAYRYFFYKSNNPLALQMATQVVDQITAAEHLPIDWEHLKPILSARKEEPNIRLYLNAYAASGLVLARLGDVDRAKEITARVKEIDDQREFGATTIFDVLTQPPEDDE
jgi:hypothetical protein